MGTVSIEQFAITGMLYPVPSPKAGGVESLIGFIDANGRIVVEPSYVLASFFFRVKPL